MNKWQPIETAPRNGTPVLLHLGWLHSNFGLIHARVGTYCDGAVCAELGEGAMGDGGWLVWNDSVDFFVAPFDAPEGWTPLPSPSGTAE